MKHLDINVVGKVQGIGFRYQTKEMADKLSLRGYARNLGNGSVEIEVEGTTPAINKFLEWLQSNPGFSIVTEVKAKAGRIKEYREFLVY